MFREEQLRFQCASKENTTQLDASLWTLNNCQIGELIEMFKFSKGLESVKWVSMIQKSTARSNRRSQLRREVVKNNQRHNFSTNQVANPWKKLPDTVVEASSVNSFKNRLDKFRAESAL